MSKLHPYNCFSASMASTWESYYSLDKVVINRDQVMIYIVNLTLKSFNKKCIFFRSFVVIVRSQSMFCWQNVVIDLAGFFQIVLYREKD